jgi:hypothetical protein
VTDDAIALRRDQLALVALAWLLIGAGTPPAEDEPPAEPEAQDTVGPFKLPAPRPGPDHINRAGAGASMGFGAFTYDPAPRGGPRVALPSLEIVTVPPGIHGQLRFRSPLLNTLVHAALRRVLHFELDAILLATDCRCPVGNHAIRPLVGPLLGLRLAAAPEHTLGGVAVGARLGFEYLGPMREVGFFVAFEPIVEVWAGSTGAGSTSALLGAGAMVQFGVTGYRQQTLPGGAP